MLHAGSHAHTHEAVHMFEDQATGLRAIIALHSTALGPAAGGCRVWRYASDDDALQDALRLSEGMTWKNALAGLPFGGGKAVLMLPDAAQDPAFDRAALFEAFGRCVESLGGQYVTAEDVGSSVHDMEQVARVTRHVAGLAHTEPGLAGGDPSPWTALGVFLSIEAAVSHRYGSDLRDVVVAVQGLGHVGLDLCGKLHAAGAKLLVSDVDRAAVARAVELFGAQAVDPDRVLGVSMDVFAPCALGAILTERTVDGLKARIVCGAANNQLATPLQGRHLAERGVLYAPDFLVNAGGIINVSAEYLGETTASVEGRVAQIPRRLLRLVQQAEQDGAAMNDLADDLAHRIVAEGRPAKVA